MKKFCLTVIILFIVSEGLLAQQAWTNKKRLMPDKLRQLPVGIIMSHDPNPCFPVLIADTFYWKHSTKVNAISRELTVIECGSYIWYDESGWHENIKYTSEEFAEAFNCPLAILKLNKTFTYLKNWRFGKQAYGGDALWYVIAKDKDGNIFKGTALIETEDKVLTANK